MQIKYANFLYCLRTCNESFIRLNVPVILQKIIICIRFYKSLNIIIKRELCNHDK